MFLATIFLIVVAFVIIGLLTYFIMIYNGLISLSKNIDKSWANIDVLLKQRHDEIPKLIKICDGYMKYERETLEKIVSMRNLCVQSRNVHDSAVRENQLSGLLGNLFALAENYPDLKSNQNFSNLQQRVSYLESQIADRREFYNDSVNNYNIRIHQLPDLFVAGLLNFRERELFKILEEEKKDVDIKFEFPK